MSTTETRVGLPSVTVCFPAYNEEATVGGVLEEAHEILSRSGLDYEIIVCDDASTDGTGRIIRAAAARLPRIRAIENPTNSGIRATFERLYAEATRDFVFLNSTDGQWRTAILLDMLPLTKQADIVIAGRRSKHYGLTRALVSWGFNLIPVILFGVRTYDAGAVKLVRREIIERFPLVSRSPFSEAERLVRASRAGYRILNNPVDTSPRKQGKGRGLSRSLVIEAFRDVFRVWRAIRAERRLRPPSSCRP